MSERVTKWRRSALFSLGISGILTLAFVTSACYPLSTSYSMTQFSMEGTLFGIQVASMNYFTLTTWTECARITAEPDAEIVCTDYSYDGKMVSDLFPLLDIENPGPTGKTVIAFQCLILILFIWPTVALFKPDLNIPFKSGLSIICLVLSTVFAILSLAIWSINCISGIRRNECSSSTCYPYRAATIRSSLSGAARFEIVIFIEILFALISMIMYQYYLNKDVPKGPLSENGDSEMSHRRTTIQTGAYYQV